MKLHKLDIAIHNKSCKPASLSRVWLAIRRALSLNHSPSSQFATSQWQRPERPSLYYLMYRWLVLLFVASVAIASFSCQKLPKNYKGPLERVQHWKWFIYLTNWGFLCIAVQSALALAVVHKYRTQRTFNICHEEEGQSPHTSCHPRSPLLCRAYWLAHTVATNLAFVITVVYWFAVYDPKIHELNTLNVMVHGFNSALMMCELMVTSHPVRFAHSIYGVCAGLTYGLFSAVYWSLGGTDRLGMPAIYPSLNWDNPGPALGFVVVCAVVMVLSHALATSVAIIRQKVAAKIPQRHFSDKITLPSH